jgi:hypothetical protein
MEYILCMKCFYIILNRVLLIFKNEQQIVSSFFEVCSVVKYMRLFLVFFSSIIHVQCSMLDTHIILCIGIKLCSVCSLL